MVDISVAGYVGIIAYYLTGGLVAGYAVALLVSAVYRGRS